MGTGAKKLQAMRPAPIPMLVWLRRQKSVGWRGAISLIPISRLNKNCPSTNGPAEHGPDAACRGRGDAQRAEREPGDAATLERERGARPQRGAVAHHREASVVKLSIGGTRFHVKVDAGPRLWLLLCLSRGRVAQPARRCGAIFVDREAQHFPKFSLSSATAMPRWSDEERRRWSARRIPPDRGAHARRGPRSE